jgi:hypothetical protein
MAYSIAELLHTGVGLRPNEAVAIAQKLINDLHDEPPHPPFGPPSIDNVTIDEFGTVTCRACAVKPAVAEIGILLEAMLPSGTWLPGGLRYTIARALLNVDASPFDSIAELSSALSRFERNDREAVIRDLVERALTIMTEGAAPAAIIPFKTSSPGRVRTERRHPVPAAVAAELRRDLRRADLERYQRQMAARDLRGALRRQKRPLGVVMAGLGAGILLIASGELMNVGGGGEREEAMPAMAAPAPRLPQPAAAFLPPAFVSDGGSPGSAVRATPAATVSGRMPSRSTSLLPASRSVRKAEGRPKPRVAQTAGPDQSHRRPRSGGVLARLRLQWIRSIFTYRRDL